MKKIIFLLIFLSNISVNAYVFIENSDIYTEFCGPFNFTRIEYTIKNPHKRDSLEFRTSLHLNKTSFISKLYLEIDEKLKEDETLLKNTGENIYKRIVQKKLDPAIITKYENGSYYLRVFPINAKEQRKIVVEYYSMLELNDRNSQDNGYFSWYISTRKQTNCTLNLAYSLPQNTYFSLINNSQFQSTIVKNNNHHSKKLHFKDCSYLKILFDFSHANKMQEYYFNNSKFTSSILNKNYKEFESLGGIPTDLTRIFNEIRNNSNLLVIRKSNDKFINAFLDYLDRKNLINTTYSYETVNWYNEEQEWQYIDFPYCFTTLPNDSLHNQDAIKCPYIQKFITYNQAQLSTLQAQKESGFLNMNLSKIVLEDNENVQQIRKSEIKKSHTILSHINNNNNNNSSLENMIFMNSNDVPLTTKSPDIKRYLFYPEIARNRKLSGEVEIQFELSIYGVVSEIKILNSTNPLFDVIAQKAITYATWIPPKQNRKHTTTHTEIFKFNSQYDNENKLKTNNKHLIFVENESFTNDEYTIFNRKFNLEIDNNIIFIEQDINKNNCIYIEEYTDTFFDVLYKNEDLIKPVYYILYNCNLDGIGLKCNDGNEYIFIRAL